ncbi:hypothetical protein Fmac_016544 [Flemingia macrophylla]|uniref:B3 domain-containing protein n=1 Tax=Flemingia macrophylla TaxID=520843 RepID=A0ABD1MHR5_9FABA
MAASRKGKQKIAEDKAKKETEEDEEARRQIAIYMLKKFPGVASADHDTKLQVLEECLDEMTEEAEEEHQEVKDEDLWKIRVPLQRCDMNNKVVLCGSDSEDESEGKPYDFDVWDVDTQTKHSLRLVQGKKSVVFTGNWNKDFLKRRELNLYDIVGFYWDEKHKRYNFSVLLRDTL